VYNKIIKKDFEASSLFVEPVPINDRPTQTGGINAPTPTVNGGIKVITKTEYVPIFFSNNKLSVSNKSALVTSANGLQEIVFGPNSLRFILSPFDNFLKFKFYTEFKSTANKSAATIIPLDLNMSNTVFRMVFDTDSGKISVDNMNSALYENPSSGELAFKIAKKDSEAIISSVNKTVYFISVSQDGTETLLYTGQWRKPSEHADVDAAITTAKAEADERDQLETKLSEINKKIDDLTSKYDKGKAATLVIETIKDLAVPSVVNKFGVKKATKIKTNSSNAK
jgi:hypothetical protein